MFNKDIDQLLADYEGQVTSDGKHTYSEHLHNDTGDCCCCDCCECGGDLCECFTSC